MGQSPSAAPARRLRRVQHQIERGASVPSLARVRLDLAASLCADRPHAQSLVVGLRVRQASWQLPRRDAEHARDIAVREAFGEQLVDLELREVSGSMHSAASGSPPRAGLRASGLPDESRDIRTERPHWRGPDGRRLLPPYLHSGAGLLATIHGRWGYNTVTCTGALGTTPPKFAAPSNQRR